ncbi:hypothetical protein [Jatrophihabitans sp.]|uniref:hypothetical protein n=1 Tax=Jatrophihabitans sp. TaxID=1932789 RepID=UPI0030C75CA8|nr:hypothetical protein [Jatrophihabitans sp.]
MKLPNLKGLWANHRNEVLAAGAAVAVGLGLVSARRQKSDAGGSDSTAAKGLGVSQPADAATGAYDSTGNDVYNALQPQLEQNQSLLASLMETVAAIPSSIQLLPAAAVGGAKPKKKKAKKRPRAGGKGHPAVKHPAAKHPKAKPKKKPKKKPAVSVRSAGLRHPPPAPHRQGARVTHVAKAGRTVVHMAPVHSSKPVRRVVVAAPRPAAKKAAARRKKR